MLTQSVKFINFSKNNQIKIFISLCILFFLFIQDSFCEDCKNFPDSTVLLTFDDGPSKFTENLLKVLKEEGVKAIFFVVGEKANTEYGRKILKRISDEGHMIANHGYRHVTMTRLTGKEQKISLSKTNDCIKEFQEKVSYFRPPGGSCDGQLKKSVRFLGMQIMFWNVDPKDWKKDKNNKRPSTLILQERILKGLENKNRRGIVLLHDIHSNTVMSVPMIIKILKKNGYSFMDPKNVSNYMHSQ
ncbi:peptidoglycan-N-acetylglucosamine deacetylase [Holospora obtusa F1]|uniref:Chitooligosaccharide deacetylase n=1 Tax=Holospora obtusa F1 TaxID=1399147 RepID=W6TF32_HOLOB|nr:polysaccharide deacetylase family protein [Holospora obtusa]ETZ07569.1 peptidoglycan-N-acetylglucosamine deacetylase [Holospora obtusa F1]